MLRTHTCGELRAHHIGHTVTMCGWVQTIRNKGSLIWIDLRDRYGLTQLILTFEESPPSLFQMANQLGREFVLQVQGIVAARSTKNPKLPTGEVEVKPFMIKLLNQAQTPPFTISNDTDGGEELRMQYRYLDLRRPILQEHVQLRHLVTQQTRYYLEKNQFLEIETPLLIKSTPGGARDLLVPSRLHKGHFYALPQSPQVFKQLLMIAGFDRYYQIAKCFRDEDFRADRQLEFTQIDCELSFVDQAEILTFFENFIKHIFQVTKGIDLPAFPVLTYTMAMERYGTDKPDMRFGMPLIPLTDLAHAADCPLFNNVSLVLGIRVEGAANFSRKQVDQLKAFLQENHHKVHQLAYIKYLSDGTFQTSLDKFYSTTMLANWVQKMEAIPGDLLLILGGDSMPVQVAMGALRLHLGNILSLIDTTTFAPLWVIDFPLLEWDEQAAQFVAMHHPFTSPKKEDIELLSTQPKAVRASAYDLVINGMEVGGGSIRIHDASLQNLIFEILGFSPATAKEKFGFLTEALKYGAPPHGGIAFGLDRLCAILAGENIIRAFIPFPKNNAGKDLMMGAPSTVNTQQVNELGLWLDK